MARKRKIIVIPSGNVQKLMKSIGCSRSAVYEALNYNRNSTLSMNIREKALKEYGGVYVDKVLFDNQ